MLVGTMARILGKVMGSTRNLLTSYYVSSKDSALDMFLNPRIPNFFLPSAAKVD